MTDPPVNRVVGRYEILREIGRGGMAIVFAARQPDLERDVALKELSRFHASSPEFAQRFLRESRLAGSLNHPNIVTVHEYFEHEGTPYIAMEYLERGSLRPLVGHLSLPQICGILEGVLAGLVHAETAHIVHRDLKPENIMVTSDGRVKIADFGIARATERAGTSFVTATGMTVGTPNYMAPEQAMARDIGPWTDLYSVGVLAYELVTGKVPFHDTDAPMAILMRHVNEPIKPAVEVDPEVDPALSAWIETLLVKDPSARVRHAARAWEALEELVVDLLGPLWRREARLVESGARPGASRPLTPAPFESGRMESPPALPVEPSRFVTYAASPAPADAPEAADTAETAGAAVTPDTVMADPTRVTPETAAAEAPTPELPTAAVPEAERPTAAVPEAERPTAAVPEAERPTAAAREAPAAPPPAGPAPPPSPPPSSRFPRRARLLSVIGAIAIAAAVGVAVAVSSGGGAGQPLSSQVPACVRRFLAGTAANETLVLGVPNRYGRAGTEEQPVGLVLGTGRPVGAIRLIHHLKPTEYFEIQGAIDASTCQPVTVSDILRPNAGSNIVPWDDLRVNLTPSPYYLRPGPESPTQIEVDFNAQRPTTS
jgi:serine/threonine protein kinase